jgi:excisionase family DNA binding protein
MALSLAEAAQATGLNRSTVLRAIKSGKISGTRDHNGAWVVEPAELFRIFPPAEAAALGVPDHAHGGSSVAAADAELRIRLQVAEERLGELKQMISDMGVRHERELTDLRGQRDSWQQQAERLALTAQGRPSSVPEHAPLKLVRRRVRWWGWSRRAG